MSEPVRCARVVEELEAYLDGELESSATGAFEAHLESCPGCAEELRSARLVRRELRALPRLEAPAPVVHRVLAQARAAGDQAPLGFPWLRPLPAAVALAGLALVVAVVLILTRAPAPESRIALDDPAVARATLETKLALAHVARAGGRVGRELGDDLLRERLVRPMARSVAESLEGGGT